MPVLEKLASKYNLSFQQNRIQPAPYITLPNDFDDYLASLDKKYRRELTRKMRNAAGYFIPIQHYIVEDEDTLETEVNDFITMMREEEEKDTFLSDKMVAQIHAIAQAAFKAGWLQLAFLKVGKEKAAGCLRYRPDFPYSSCGPGRRRHGVGPSRHHARSQIPVRSSGVH